MIKVSWRNPGQNGWFRGPFFVHWDVNLLGNSNSELSDAMWDQILPRTTECLCMIRALIPDTPRPPKFQLTRWTTKCGKLDFQFVVSFCVFLGPIRSMPPVLFAGRASSCAHGPLAHESWPARGAAHCVKATQAKHCLAIPKDAWPHPTPPPEKSKNQFW